MEKWHVGEFETAGQIFYKVCKPYKNYEKIRCLCKSEEEAQAVADKLNEMEVKE